GWCWAVVVSWLFDERGLGCLSLNGLWVVVCVFTRACWYIGGSGVVWLGGGMNPPGRCRVNIFGYIPPPCAASPAWRYPSGFAGVSFATVSGLVVGWLVVVEVVDAGVVECVGHTSVRFGGRDWWPRSRSSCWPSSLLMAWA